MKRWTPKVTAHTMLRVNMPELFENKGFARRLNEYVKGATGGMATWHRPGDPTEFSDIFVTYDQGEGSNVEDIPARLWKKLGRMAENQGLTHTLFWITNFKD